MSHQERSRNIDALRHVLTGERYSGYDIIIVSSSTVDEARCQQDLLDRAFRRVRSDNAALHGRVLVLSVDDPTEGGQLIGQAMTWRRAIDAAAAAGHDLVGLASSGAVRIAIYHNGGKGERASPLTQGLGNSRGSQRLVGTVPLSDGSEAELELLLAVVLQTAALAPTNDGGAIDTFWTSQLLFDSKPAASCRASGAAIEKFIVGVARDELHPKALYDFGTALLRPDGTVEAFFGNKQFGRPSASGGWEIVEERRRDWDADGFELGLDFGSFRTDLRLHLDLMRYYDRELARPGDGRDGRVSPSRARDIDPHLLQPLATIAGALARVPGAVEPGVHARLRGLDDRNRDAALAAVIDELHSRLAEVAGRSFATANPDGMRDALGFFLLHGDRPYFADPRRIVGSIRFEPDAYWLTYRRPIDIGNDKLRMLADLGGAALEIDSAGHVTARSASDAELLFARDARRLRGIPDDAVCRFRAGDSEHCLTREQARRGVEVAGVFVRGSVIAGNTVLQAGSRIEDSVLDNVTGRVEARRSWLESVTAPEVRADASILHRCVAPGSLVAAGEIVSDAFRAGIEDRGFPAGQVRLRAPIGYDAQARVELDDGRTVKRDEITRSEGGAWTFAEVRAWPSERARNDATEREIRSAVESAARGRTGR